jgi:hypothetical protein
VFEVKPRKSSQRIAAGALCLGSVLSLHCAEDEPLPSDYAGRGGGSGAAVIGKGGSHSSGGKGASAATMGLGNGGTGGRKTGGAAGTQPTGAGGDSASGSGGFGGKSATGKAGSTPLEGGASGAAADDNGGDTSGGAETMQGGRSAGGDAGSMSGVSGSAAAGSVATAGAAGTSGGSGAAGRGGIAGGGGTAGAGGTAGGSGASGAGTAGALGSGGMPQIDWHFDSGVESWRKVYAVPTSLLDRVSVAYADGEGDPAPGALEVTIPFSTPTQKVEIAVDPIPGLDLTGKTIKARIKLVSGCSEDISNPCGVVLYVKTGSSFNYFSAPWLDGVNDLDVARDWFTITLNVDAPGGSSPDAGAHNPSQVRQIGIEVATGSGGSAYTNVVLLIDSVTYE